MAMHDILLWVISTCLTALVLSSRPNALLLNAASLTALQSAEEGVGWAGAWVPV